MKNKFLCVFALLLSSALFITAADYICTTNNGMITITKYTGPGGDVAIPGTMDGLPVTSIGAAAFSDSTSLTSLAIPGSITNIGLRAFERCTGLAAISVDPANASYRSVDGILFTHDEAVLVQYPAAKLGSSYTIPATVLRVGPFAFSDNSNLTSVAISESITNIGQSAFQYCSSLAGVTMSVNLISIGPWAFTSSRNLTNLFIPSSVTSIGNAAFQDCSGLSAINVAPGNSLYCSVEDVLFNKAQNILIKYPEGKLGTNYTIPSSVSVIDWHAFHCSRLVTVTIPESVTTLRGYAFYGSFGLVEISIPQSVTNIGDYALPYCSVLTAITVDPRNPCYCSAEGVLFNKSQTKLLQYPGGKSGITYTIPPTVTDIGVEAFCYATRLTNITIPNRLTAIGDYAFRFCTNLGSITIPDSVVTIGRSAFYYCSQLASVRIPRSVANIGSGAFQGSGLSSIYFWGDAPGGGSDSSMFLGANSTRVYYLPGTTGWNSTFAGRPTALWSLPYPVILAHGPAFGCQSNRFGFVISWATNASVVVESTVDLFHPVWLPAGTNTLTNGYAYFSDSQSMNFPIRFYRIRPE